MVYNSKTLKPYHQLSETGKKNYQFFLEKEADEIIWRSQHPIRWFTEKTVSFIKNLFGIS